MVESHISKLRKKLKHALGYDPIDTKRYLGYQLVGHQRIALHAAPEPEVGVREVEGEPDMAERARAVGKCAPVVVERPHVPPLLEQQVEIDVGHRPPVPVREPLRLGEQHTVLVDGRLAVPRQIGR